MLDCIVPDWPAPPQVKALTTTRRGGCSVGPYAGLNLAEHVGDDPHAVAANRRRLAAHVGAPPLWLNQVHGTRCVRADQATLGETADACFTERYDRACAVLTADCLPLLLCDEAGTAVAAAHAGWRGLAAGVIEATLAAMVRPPQSLMAWLGPAIGPQAFEVGDEVRAQFVATDTAAADAFLAGRPGKWMCDLYALTRLRLAQSGVVRVFGGRFCTVGDGESFFSYRRDGITGRMATLIWLEA